MNISPQVGQLWGPGGTTPIEEREYGIAVESVTLEQDSLGLNPDLAS